jgi:hypothetical protein
MAIRRKKNSIFSNFLVKLPDMPNFFADSDSADQV